MWIGMLWAGLQVAMWITHVGGTFRQSLLEKSLNAGIVRHTYPKNLFKVKQKLKKKITLQGEKEL